MMFEGFFNTIEIDPETAEINTKPEKISYNGTITEWGTIESQYKWNSAKYKEIMSDKNQRNIPNFGEFIGPRFSSRVERDGREYVIGDVVYTMISETLSNSIYW